MSLRRNITSNLVASVWITLLTLAITPIQLRLLGIEAYALIGFIATLQIVFTMFDFGLSSTLTRHLASDHSPGHRDSETLVRSATTIYWCAAIVAGTLLAVFASTISDRWFNSSTLSARDVEHALDVIALFLAARWPIALYVGVLTGLQRIAAANAVKTAAASLRLLGGIAVLIAWPRLEVFLWWTVANSVIEVIAYMVVCERISGLPLWRPGFSSKALKSVWGFSLSMSLISMLGLVISQLDRLMISKMLPLVDLGHYTLAYNAASTISLGIGAVSSAMLPAFANASSRDASEELNRRYEQASRAIFFVTGFAVFPLLFFGEPILSAWVGPAAASAATRPLTLLVIGFWLAAALSNAYSMTIATGHPGLTLRLSALSAVPYGVVLYLLVGSAGIDGAALAWLLLNLAYVVCLVPVTHRRLLNVSTRHWFTGTMAPFLALGLAAFGLPRLALAGLDRTGHPVHLALALVVAICCYAAVGVALLGPTIRREIVSVLSRSATRRPPGESNTHTPRNA